MIALGWLGWTEEQTLYSDMNAIILGHTGRVKMVNAIMGAATGGRSGPPRPDASSVTVNNQPAPIAAPPITASAFDALFSPPQKPERRSRAPRPSRR